MKSAAPLKFQSLEISARQNSSDWKIAVSAERVRRMNPIKGVRGNF
jgi:hypothetical protein